jgi:hypothetical protein
MKRLFNVGLFFLVLSQLLLGCGSLDVQSRKAADADLSKYRTFSFAQAMPASDARFLTPTNETRVKAAIRSELENRGLHFAEPADLQFCVYLKTQAKQLDKQNPSVASGSASSNLGTYYGLLYDNSWGTQNVLNYHEGTLVVQAVDVRQNRKVWEGVATGVVHRNNPDDRVIARIREAVTGMFKNFP